MKKVLVIILVLISSLSYGQIRYNQLPDLDSLAGGDYVPVFRPPFNQGKATFQTLVDYVRDSIAGGSAVDTIWRVPGVDSIYFTINGGETRRIKDSTGGGGSVDWGDIGGTIEDQADLQAALGGKLDAVDTTTMLAPYLREVDTASLSARVNAKADTTLRPAMYAKYLPADTSTSSTSAVGTGLLFPIGTNEVWQVRVVGTVSKAVSTTGLKIAVGAPSGCTVNGIESRGQASLSTAPQMSLITAINTLGATFSTGAGVVVTFWQDYVIESAGAAGNVELQFATVISNAATVYKYTKLTAIRNKN